MTITYHGHSCFKIKGKRGTIIMDPYDDAVGFVLPRMSADIVTTSHNHFDHNATSKVSGTARRDEPFIVREAGEYEVGRISVFGVQTYHDTSRGTERGTNIVYTVFIDEMRLCHLGDLGHELTAEQLEEIGSVDVLLCPVGGSMTIDPEQAVKTIRTIEPSIVIPMHYATDEHDKNVFADLKTLEDFLQEYGTQPAPQTKLDISASQLGEETELVVLRQT